MILIALFCILLGCEKKDGARGALTFTSVKEAEMASPEEAEKEQPQEQEKALEEEAALKQDAENEDQEIQGETSLKEEAGQREICAVHICGAVEHPGVYTLDAESRIYQVVEAAGGFLDNAGQDYLNQAARIADGMKIYVPTVEELEELETAKIAESTGIVDGSSRKESEAGSQGSAGEGLVDINTAGRELLCTLPGIGQSKAESIIAYREKNGAYDRIEDIMNVEGIKEGLFQKIKDSITV